MGPQSSRNLPSLRTLTNEAEQALDSLQITEPLRQKPLVVNGVVVGPFEEEEEPV